MGSKFKGDKRWEELGEGIAGHVWIWRRGRTGGARSVYMSAVPKGGALYLLENRHRIITSTVSGGVKTEKAEGVRRDRE
jgi:hypothetical protein